MEKTIANELIQGMELAKQLRGQLGSTTAIETRDLLVQRILASYEKALLMVKCSGSQMHNVGATSGVLPESPLSITGSPGSEDFDRETPESKKRKTLTTERVRVGSDSMLEGPHDDGCSWRKYGQKEILGAKYPRSYYRCTFRSSQNCWATKQVQRSDDDPTMFEVTYRGTHTCRRAAPTPASPENKEEKLTGQSNNQQEMLLNYKRSLRVNTEGDMYNNEMAHSFSFPSTFNSMENVNLSFSTPQLDDMTAFSPPFMSPATPELNYFPSPHSQRNNGDLTEMISAHNSATNSPIMDDLDFSLDHVDIDPHFPFDTPGFFS